MSSTKSELATVDSLANSLFSSTIVPLAADRKSLDAPPYFAISADPSVSSYFEQPSVTKMTPQDFEFPGDGTADGLIDALAAHWERQGENSLATMAPALKEIAAALKEEAEEGDGTVDILCYTMF